MRKRKWNLDEAIRLYKAGIAPRDIAPTVGASRGALNTAISILRKRGEHGLNETPIRVPGRPPAVIDRAELVRLRAAGNDVTTVARKMRTSDGRVMSELFALRAEGLIDNVYLTRRKAA